MALVKPRGTTAAARTTRPVFEYKARTPEQVRARATATSGRDSFVSGDVQFFTPADGPNTIRILPPPPDAEWRHYGFTIFAHNDIGADEAQYLCRSKMLNEPCACCEERDRASGAGEDDLVDALYARQSTLIYVIDRKNEDKGPLLWRISAGSKKSMDTRLLNLCIDPATGEVLSVDNPEEGYDLSFVRVGKGRDTTYTGHQFSRRPSPLSDDPELAAKWLQYVIENALDSDKVIKFYDYDYVKQVLEGQHPPAPAEPAPQTRTTAHKPATPAAAPVIKPRAAPAPAAPPVQAAAAQGPLVDVTYEELQQLDQVGLEGLFNEAQFVPPAEGFNDIEELRQYIADQLQLEPPPPPEPAAAAAPAAGGWRARLAAQTGKK